jgi:hypothetical protein
MVGGHAAEMRPSVGRRTDETAQVHRRADPGNGQRGRRPTDFTVDTLADGRGFCTLNTVDDFTQECVAIEVNRSVPGLRLPCVLDRLHATIGLPQAIVVDYGRSMPATRSMRAHARDVTRAA